MKFYPRPSPVAEPNTNSFTITLPLISSEKLKKGLLILLIIVSNLMTYYWFGHSGEKVSSPKEHNQSIKTLYLMDEARAKLPYPESFAINVDRIARRLQIPASWLMAVMFAESGFDPNVFNRKGSGAVGLIQFMPATAEELGVAVANLSQMEATDQLDYVLRYFEMVRDRYGPYQSLTDLYLAVLYPKARNQDPCYTLYASPSKSYQQNRGLDENQDGRVTVSDIEKRMVRLFPQAYHESLADKNK